MSVTKRGTFYHFDFWYGGVRYRGSTGQEEKKAAKRVEKAERQRARDQKYTPKNEIKLGAAFYKYHEEHAMHLASAATIEYQLENLKALGNKNLSEVTDGDLAKYVTKRRAKVSESSVNREVTLFRAVCNRAANNWGYDVPSIRWGAHLYQEPAPRQNTLSDDQQELLLAKLPEDLRPFVLFAVLTGARLGSITSLTWKQVDFQNMTATLKVKSRRKGETHTIPLTTDLIALLANEKGNHPIYVFTYECKRNRPKRKKGKRYPLTQSNWRRFWKDARKAAGVPEFRFHDLRHTAATRLLQGSGNVAVVQRLLGHSDIKTTMRYAHVMLDDVRAAMVSTTPHKITHMAESQNKEKEQKA